jgi:anti-sigma factor ChrR (cupin superfamily)
MSKSPRKPTDGEALEPQAIAALGAALVAEPLPADLSARMRERVMGSVQAPDTAVVRASEGEWKTLLPGITVKTLHIDREQGTQTSLWRLAGGARIPRHPHSKDEECLVLEGEIVHEGVHYGPGDYLFSSPGVRHREFTAPEGALLLIRSELLPSPWLLWIAAHWPL